MPNDSHSPEYPTQEQTLERQERIAPQRRQGPPTADVLADPAKRERTGRNGTELFQEEISPGRTPNTTRREEASRTTKLDP